MNSRKRLILTVVALGVAAVVIFIYLSLSPLGSPPLRCAFKAATGFDCPGCGSQRAFQALFRGDIDAAWGYNPFAIVAAPLAVFMIVVEVGKYHWPRLHRAVMSRWVLVSVGVLVVGWWIFRNL